MENCKVKMFVGQTYELDNIENQVNNFLKDKKIIDIRTTNADESYTIVLTIIYSEKSN